MEKASEIQKNFEENLEKLDLSSKDKLIETFQLLWNSEKELKKHINKRLKYNQIDINNPEIDYMKKTFETLEKSISIIYEKPKKNAPRDWHKLLYNKENEWIVIVGENGKLITSYPLDCLFETLLQIHGNSYEFYKLEKEAVNDRFRKIIKDL